MIDLQKGRNKEMRHDGKNTKKHLTSLNTSRKIRICVDFANNSRQEKRSFV
jgi:hypothetical protein